MKRFLSIVLSSMLLLGCVGCAKEVKEVTLDESAVIVSSQETMQAALSLKVTLAQKCGLDLEIKEAAEGGTAIVVAVDESLADGQYRTHLEESRIYIEAKSVAVLNIAMRDIRSKWLVADPTPRLQASQCDALSGTIDLKSAPIFVLDQNIRYTDDEGGNLIVDRAPRFRQLAEEYLPDIIALQEDSKIWAAILDKFFGDNYGMYGMFSAGPDTTKGHRQSIFYNKDRFEAVEEGAFLLSDTPDEYYTKFEDSKSIRHTTWVLLKDKYTGQDLFICNVHLDNSTDEVRGKQLGVLLERLKGYMEQYPTIFLGDFNARPETNTYATVTEFLSDPYITATTKLSDLEYTCDKYGAWAGTDEVRRIDYLFYSDELVADTYCVMTDQYGGYISDHFGVTVQFSYAK